jgi:hypothetical protein
LEASSRLAFPKSSSEVGKEQELQVFSMDYAQKQKFAAQIALAAVCTVGVTALICAQTPEDDEEWEVDSTTADMAEKVIDVCHFLIHHSHSGCKRLIIL